MDKILYAIGDIHGYDNLLEKMHTRIISYHQTYYRDHPAVLIHIGDYIDGGPDSIAVIDRLMSPDNQFEHICLLGNHEDMLLQCLETDDRYLWNNWLNNGGISTLTSLGISFRFGGYDSDELKRKLGKQRINWLRSLPLYFHNGKYLFVHAGIMPGKPLEQQQKNDLLWIRDRFLQSEADHGYCIVHGHTPTDDVVIKHNRIGIDTGVHSKGKLSAIMLAPNNKHHVFTIQEDHYYS